MLEPTEYTSEDLLIYSLLVSVLLPNLNMLINMMAVYLP